VKIQTLATLIGALIATQAATAAPAVLNYALMQEPPQLDSTKSTDTQSSFVLGHILEGLTRTDKNGATIPAGAEKWEINDKGATFHLRKNALWSDGKPVTAKDYIFSWKKTLDPKNASEYAFILYPIKGAEAINTKGASPDTLGVTAADDHTLKITFESPCGYFVSLTSHTTYYPIRQDFYDAQAGRFGADAANILFNGPFVLTEWKHGASLTLDKNPHYWNKAKIALDQIKIPYIVPDASAQFNFFKDNKIDVLERMKKEDLPKAQSQGMRVKTFSDGSVFFLEFNFRDGRATRNKNLRKAIQAAFNPDEFVAKVVGIPGTGPGLGFIPKWVRGTKDTFRKEFPLPKPKADLAKAKQFVEAAKKELGGTIPPLAWLTQDTPLAAQEAEYFQAVLKQIGIDLRIDKQIFKQRLAKMTAGEFDIVSAGWGPDYPDAMTFADLKASWNLNNRGRYSSPEYDKAIREALATTNVKKRMEAMARAEKIGLDDVANLPTYERIQAYLVNDRVEGVIRSAFSPDPDFTQASVKK
jgi:oligopeptide transport system substrate-binding protein